MLKTTMTAVGFVLLSGTAVMGAGQSVGVKHPVLKHDIDPAKAAEYEKAVERVMAMSEEEMLSFVPDKPFANFCYCPNCHGGSQGLGVLTWTVDRPNEIKCRYCGMVFPNAQYPDDQIIEGRNPLGETVSYRYHQDEKRDDLRMFFRAHLAKYRRNWLVRQYETAQPAMLYRLGIAYHATGRPEYARRAVLILDRLAHVYPRYPMMRQWITTFEFPKSQQPPYSPYGGRWGRWMDNELPVGAVQSYDLVYDSDEFDKLSKSRGYDVREKVEEDFLLAAYEYMLTFKRHDGNIAPRYLRTAIQMGKVLGEPRCVHWGYHWLLQILDVQCFYDGMWHEAPGYHHLVMRYMTPAFEEIRGYSDPAGYVDKLDGQHFENFDPDKDIAFFAKAKDAPKTVRFPNGVCSPNHDTGPNSRRGEPTAKTGSGILPGYGHASLGCGEGAGQMQAQLHFSGCYGHAHLDNLNLILWAKGREMVSDIGGIYCRLRWWNGCSIGHNLVVIDRQNQGHRQSDGDLLWFFPCTKGVAVVQADGKRAYKQVKDLQRYRRMLVLVPVSRQDAYVVDLFRVTGGATQDWLIHGDADADMTAACSVRLEPGPPNMLEPGEEWEEPKTERSRFNAYGVIRDVRLGRTEADVVTTFNYVKEPKKGLRIHMLGAGTTEVFLGRSPSVRRAGRDARKMFDYWMPQLVLRRRGAAPLANTFVAVEEPFEGEPFISAVERVELRPADEGCIALRVRHGDTVDTIISTLDEPPYPERATADDVRIKGRLGLVRKVAGQAAGAWLFEGEMLAGGGRSLQTDKSRHAGEITAAVRKADGAEHDAFITNVELPVGRALGDTWMIVTHGNGYKHGYEIQRVHRHNGKTVIVLTHDHGLRIDGDRTKEVYFPHRDIKGRNEFVIPLAAAVERKLPNKGEQNQKDPETEGESK